MVGRGLAELLLTDSGFQHTSWVHRRVEHVRFLDDRTVRRQMSVDFTLPADDELVSKMLAQTPVAYVPLALLRKQTLLSFGLWDETGDRRPMLTAGENAELSGAVLVAMAWHLAIGPRSDGGAGLGALPHQIADALRLVARLPTYDALFLLRAMEYYDYYDRRRYLQSVWIENWQGGWTPGSEVRTAVRALRAHRQLLRVLFRNATFRSLAYELATGFLLVVPMPHSECEDRHVFKFAYHADVKALSGRPRAARILASLVASFSFAAQGFQLFDDMAGGRAESHHVEIEAPPEMELMRAALTSTRLGDEYDRVAQGVAQLVHLSIREAPWDMRFAAGVSMRAARVGLVRAAVVVAALTSLELLLGKGRTDQLTADPGTALLLLVPAALATVVVRPGEHRLATRTLLGVRVLVLLSGLCALAAAGAVAAGYEHKALHERWTYATWASLVVTLMLLLSYILPVRAGRSIKDDLVRCWRYISASDER